MGEAVAEDASAVTETLNSTPQDLLAKAGEVIAFRRKLGRVEGTPNALTGLYEKTIGVFGVNPRKETISIEFPMRDPDGQEYTTEWESTHSSQKPKPNEQPTSVVFRGLRIDGPQGNRISFNPALRKQAVTEKVTLDRAGIDRSIPDSQILKRIDEHIKDANKFLRNL